MRVLLGIGTMVLAIAVAVPASAQSSATSSSAQSSSASSVQTGTDSTQSGSGNIIQIPTLRQRSVFLLDGVRLPPRKGIDDLLALWETSQEERRAYRTRLRQHLQDCHDGLRKANRDQKFPLTLQCFRGRLMLELTWLRKERQFFAGDVSLVEDARADILDATDALIDGIATIVTAVDSDVYASESGLREARTLLHTQYRLRQWAASIRAAAARMRILLAFMAKDLGGYLPVQEDPLLPTPWDGSVECLEDTSDMLRQTESIESYDAILSAWSAARASLSACIETIDEAMKSAPKSGSGTALQPAS
jgi:hypothetical protein